MCKCILVFRFNYVSILYRFWDIQRQIMAWPEIWVSAHSESLKMVPFQSIGFLFPLSNVHGPILYNFWYKARYWSNIAIFSYSLEYDAPLGRSPSEYCHKTVSLLYQMMKKWEYIYSLQYDTLTWRTDRRTDTAMHIVMR